MEDDRPNAPPSVRNELFAAASLLLIAVAAVRIESASVVVAGGSKSALFVRSVPAPLSGDLSIRMPLHEVDRDTVAVEVVVYDQRGEVQRQESVGANQREIVFNGLPPGFYSVALSSPNKPARVCELACLDGYDYDLHLPRAPEEDPCTIRLPPVPTDASLGRVGLIYATPTAPIVFVPVGSSGEFELQPAAPGPWPLAVVLILEAKSNEPVVRYIEFDRLKTAAEGNVDWTVLEPTTLTDHRWAGLAWSRVRRHFRGAVWPHPPGAAQVRIVTTRPYSRWWAVERDGARVVLEGFAGQWRDAVALLPPGCIVVEFGREGKVEAVGAVRAHGPAASSCELERALGASGAITFAGSCWSSETEGGATEWLAVNGVSGLPMAGWRTSKGGTFCFHGNRPDAVVMARRKTDVPAAFCYQVTIGFEPVWSAFAVGAGSGLGNSRVRTSAPLEPARYRVRDMAGRSLVEAEIGRAARATFFDFPIGRYVLEALAINGSVATSMNLDISASVAVVSPDDH